MTRTLHKPHRCDLPNLCWADHGQVEQCEDCGRVWRACIPGNPKYSCWRPVGRLRRWMMDRRDA